MRRRAESIGAIVLLALFGVGCVDAPAGTTPAIAASASSTLDTSQARTDASGGSPDEGAINSEVEAMDGRGAPPVAPVSSTAADDTSMSIQVPGGPLPRDVVQAIRDEGGELADAEAWSSRYPTVGLPLIVGDGVRLIEARLELQRTDSGYRRTDEMQWLFLDESRADVASLLDDVAGVAGVVGLPVDEAASAIDGASCLERTYGTSADDASTVWRLHGCSYPKFPSMFAIGIDRTMPVTSAVPLVVEPSVAAVEPAINGEVNEVSVSFGHPLAINSVTTLRTSVVVSFTGGLQATVEALRTGPLSGWRQIDGDESVVFESSTGSRWVVSEGRAEFTSEGRLQP